MGHMNNVQLFGTICRAPRVRLGPNSAQAQFQLAVNRPGRRPAPPSELTFDEEEALTDHPWVYVRGDLATQCAEYPVGTLVLVRGRFDTRFVPTRWPWPLKHCPHCGVALETELDPPTTCPGCEGSLELRAHNAVEVYADRVFPVPEVVISRDRTVTSLPPDDDVDSVDVVSGPGPFVR